MSEENKTEQTEEAKDFSIQEENWHLMVFCGMPWQDAAKVEGDDREFLLKKAEEGKLEVLKRKKEAAEEQMKQEQAMLQMQQQMQQQQQAAQMMPSQMPHQQNPMMPGMPPHQMMPPR